MQLLERDDQLATLDARLADVRGTGRGQLILLAGEAGAGKTAVVRAFEARQRAVTVHTGACEALFTPRPLGPLLDIAAEVGGELAELTERGATASEVLAALAREVRGTAVVVVEDLHWADEATLDLVHLLGRRAAGMPVLFIATYRDDQLERNHPLRVVLGELSGAHRMTVEPLSAGAVEDLAAPLGVDGAALHARTGGNAFYVTEVLAREDAATPATVRDAVLARAARLDPPARRLLEAVAIARPRAEIWLLEQIAPDELPELEACVASGMLRAERDAVAFRHEIARATIEDALAPDRHVALHRAALAALAGRGEPARLAHHAEAAGDGAAVLQYSKAAGDRAVTLGAHREAAAHFGAALKHADGLAPEARASLLERRAIESFMCGEIRDAVEAETRALELYRASGNRLREGDAYRWLALLAWYEGDGARELECATTAVEILETLPPSIELARAYAQRGAPYLMNRDLAGVQLWGQKSIELAERLGATEVLLVATREVGTTEYAHDLLQGREMLRSTVDLALDAGLESHVAVGYCNLVSGAHEVRDYDAALADLETGRRYCEEHDLLHWDTYLGGWAARIALDHGHWAEAAAVAQQTLARTRGSLPHSRFRSLLALGVLHARRGDGDPWPPLDEVLAMGIRGDELEVLGPAAATRAEARWLAGETDRVAEETDVALPRALAVDHRWTIGELAIWRHRAGLPRPDDKPLPRPYEAEIAGDVRAAAEFWNARGCRYDAALALAGSDDEDDLRESLQVLQALGARPAAGIVAQRLRELGARSVPLGPRATTRANPAGLTPRQLDVLELISEGARNADIAAKLFLSEKTVDHHVSAILRKLGVHSRGQAAAEASRLGIGR
ncbi:MAG TPA: LuxR C-terminal-related transcriptional regulator [Solirubrobacteraceae bacterium]|nr:LuxR C-terminal-related transcriptional regulator [Solirubrobacteraceae bacterium]